MNWLVSSIKKEPVAYLTLIVTLVVGVLTSDLIWRLLEGELVADVYTIEHKGRCVDRELVITNNKATSVRDVKVQVIADRFTRNRDIVLLYGHLQDMLISPYDQTLAPRKIDLESKIPVESLSDHLLIPLMNPGERMHLTFSESVNDMKYWEIRDELIKNRDRQIIDKPKIGDVTYLNGKGLVNRHVVSPACREFR